MKIKLIIGLCIVFFNFICCNNVKHKDTSIDFVDKLVGNKIDLYSSLGLKRNDNNALIIYFNGDCSTCIGGTLTWLKKYNKLSPIEGVDCYIISRSIDTHQIEIYLEQMNVKLKNNQFLKVDPNDSLIKKYPFLDTYRNILLIDKENIILSSIDPFESRKVKEIYKAQGVF